MTIAMARFIETHIMSRLDDSTNNPKNATLIIYGTTGTYTRKLVDSTTVGGDVTYRPTIPFYEWSEITEKIGKVTSIEIATYTVSIEFNDSQYRVDKCGTFEIYNYQSNWSYINNNDLSEVVAKALEII